MLEDAGYLIRVVMFNYGAFYALTCPKPPDIEMSNVGN